MQFAHIEILIFLALIPILVILYHAGRISLRKRMNSFASENLFSVLAPLSSPFRSHFKFYIVLTSLSFAIIALAGPRVGSRLKEKEVKGREIIVALDVSGSMLAEDIQPNRLERAKQSLIQLIEKLEQDKFGLIIFAGDAYTQVPLTGDYSSARLFVETLNTEVVSKQGTNISSAIDLAVRSFTPQVTDQSAESRALIIITDGENHEPGVFESVELAREKGITIHTVGLGNPSGVPIPLFPGSKDYKKDREGNIVVSKLDEKTLREIAAMTQGIYVHSGAGLGLLNLLEKLNEMEQEKFTSKVFVEYDERFPFFAGIALFLLVCDLLIRYRKNSWLSKFKLFG